MSSSIRIKKISYFRNFYNIKILLKKSLLNEIKTHSILLKIYPMKY